MVDYQKIVDLYNGKLKIEDLLSDANLSYNDKRLINLISEGKNTGMTASQMREWFIKIVKSPFIDQNDTEIIEVLGRLASDAAQ